MGRGNDHNSPAFFFLVRESVQHDEATTTTKVAVSVGRSHTGQRSRRSLRRLSRNLTWPGETRYTFRAEQSRAGGADGMPCSWW